MLQNNRNGGAAAVATFIAGQSRFDQSIAYDIPFVVSRDGRVVASYRFANWTGGKGPDLLYQSEGKAGLLRNGGLASGWQPMAAAYAPPVNLDARSHLVDLDCNRGKLSLIGATPDQSGVRHWMAYRFATTGWEEETDPRFRPPFSADTDPEAVRELKIDVGGQRCDGLVVAQAGESTLLT